MKTGKKGPDLVNKNIIGELDHRRTLIVGDINTGKTRLTGEILADWTSQGRSDQITILDLTPEPIKGIGGRLERPATFQGRYLTTVIVPPRLTGKTEIEAENLAARNAEAIEDLLRQVRLVSAPILIVNDATLYLQAGDYDRFMAVVQTAETVLINAYYGHSFPEYRLSQQERHLTDRLIQESDRVIRLPHPDYQG